MNVIIYTRVSTEEQTKGNGLQFQERDIRSHCQLTGKVILKHYQEDHSAKNFNRPVFKELMNDLKSKRVKPKQLIVHRMDRFSRNFFDSLVVKKNLESFGVDLYCLDGNFDMSVPENIIPALFQMALPQVENDRRALNTKKGMRQALRAGKWVWKAPKGYLNGTEGGEIIKSPDSRFIIKAFEAVALNLNSVDSIRLHLNSLGFKVSKQQFLNLLKNPFYKGYIKIKEWRDEKEEIIKGLHEPLVDEYLFERVQAVLLSKSKRQTKVATNSSLFPLRGHLICNKCGSRLTASSSKGRSKKYAYYHCQKGCKERFGSDYANHCFDNYLSSFVVNNAVSELYLEILKDEFDKNEGSKEEQIKVLKTQIGNFERKGDCIDNDYSNGKLPLEHYLRLINKNNEKIDQLNMELNALKVSPTRFDKHLKYGINLIKHLPYYYKSSPVELKHKIIGSIFSDNLIFDGSSYRTERVNTILELVCSESIDYRKGRKEKTSFSRGQSNWAPLTDERCSYNSMIEYVTIRKFKS